MGPSSEVILVDPEDFRSFLSTAVDETYVQIAVCSLLAYDTCLTFDKEVKHFWESPRKIVSVIYFTNRYVGLLGVVSNLLGYLPRANPELCYHANWFSSLASSIILMAIDYILVVRVLALYTRGKRIVIILWTLLGLECLCSFACFFYFDVIINFTTKGAMDDSSMYYCYSPHTFPWFLGLIDWLIPMIYAILYMALAMYKARKFRKFSAGLHVALVKVLVKDQLVYFAIVTACCASNILLHLVDIKDDFTGLLVLVKTLANPFLLSILGSRMSINLKEAGEHKVYSMGPSGDMEFAVFAQSQDNAVQAGHK